MDTTHPARNGRHCIVYHGSASRPADFGAAPDADWRPSETVGEQASGVDGPAVLLVDVSMLEHTREWLALPSHVVVVATDEPSASAFGARAQISLAGVDDAAARSVVLDAACQLACARLAALLRRRQIGRSTREVRELNRIGSALMHEKDRTTLLHLILEMGKELTVSDGAAVLLIEKGEADPLRMRAELYDFDSLPDLSLMTGRTVPVDNSSVMGHAAMTRRPVIVDDVYQLPPDADFGASHEFDKRYGYRLKSMLVVPMVDQLGHAIGVLMFVNRKRDRAAVITTKEAADRYVVPYTNREARLAHSLAGQATVALENAGLYSQIENILEGVVKASVTAIDERDPTTAGHSMRVAKLTDRLAEAVEQFGTGRYQNVHFTWKERRELWYAALLHDFGKVTVHEDVLTKAKKLPPVLWERVNARFDLIRQSMEIDNYRERDRVLRSGVAVETALGRLEADLAAQVADLERMRGVVCAANEPTVQEQPVGPELADIAARTFERPDGTRAPYLTAEELCFLQLRRGTLDDHERLEIQSHVEETYRYLIRIPWTDDLKNLSTYAYGHHEKLNGTGYPRQLVGDEIPLQARLISLADMFDALTEGDRPYKPAVPPEQALDIIRADAKAGLVDEDLVAIMTESQAYRRPSEDSEPPF